MSAAESPAELIERLAREKAASAARRPPPHPVGITGTRNREPRGVEMEAFWRLWDRLGGTELHHGNQHGIDKGVAKRVRRARPQIEIVPHPALWDLYGKGAGPIRNEQLVLAVRELIAFPGGTGTHRCIESAKRMGHPVLSIEEEIIHYRREVEREILSTALAP